MRRIIGALTMLLLAGALFECGSPLPGGHPKPVPTYTPAPAWSWPYGKSEMAPVSFTWPKPTTPPVAKRRIEIVDQVKPTKWHIGVAAEWLDRYTGSNMVTVTKCTSRAWRCVYVRGGKLPGSYLGFTDGNVITIDTGKVDRHGYRSETSRRKILAHELGHANGLGHHSGNNLMAPRISHVRFTLTAGQRRYLAAR